MQGAYDPYASRELRSALGDTESVYPEVLEARQEVAVMEAAAALLEEKLAAAALEAANAREAQARAEERAAALEAETAWLQQRLVAQQSDGDSEAAERLEQLKQLRKEVGTLRTERDAAQAAVKGQLQELRVGASAVGAKIALTEQLERIKTSIAPLQAALEAERAWSKEMEAQLEGEKTAKLALAAKSSAMVKALRAQLDDAKNAAVAARTTPMPSTPMPGQEAAGGAGPSFTYGAEAEAKAAMEERKALAREVQFLKDRTKLLTEQVEKERAQARDRELRLKGKYDAMLDRSRSDAEGAQVAALNAQVADLQAALEGAFEREAELKQILGRQ